MTAVAHIAVVVPHAAPARLGGAELQAQEWARHLSVRHTMTVITRRNPPDASLREERDGYTVLRPVLLRAAPAAVPAQLLPASWRGNSVTRFLRSPQRKWRESIDERALLRCVDALEPKPDFLLCFATGPMGLLTVRVGQRLGIPTAVWIQTENDYRRGSAAELRARSRQIWERATGVLVQSETGRSGLLAALDSVSATSALRVRDKLAVLENGVDLPVPAEFCPDGPVLSVGRLIPDKAMDVVIDACARLGRPLVIAGVGPQLAALQEQAVQLGADVRFAGQLDRGALAGLYRQASVLVLASHREGLPNVVGEAMAQARPVVVTRVGGLPDLVRDGVNGLLIPPGDPEALASALARLAGDPAQARRLGAAARVTIEEFSWERMVPRLEAVLEQFRAGALTAGASRRGHG